MQLELKLWNCGEGKIGTRDLLQNTTTDIYLYSEDMDMGNIDIIYIMGIWVI